MPAGPVRLSDAIIPDVFLDYTEVNSPEKIVLMQSGIIRQDEGLNAASNRGGNITTIPFWNDLDASVEPNISTDNPADVSTPQGVNAGEMVVRVGDYNQSWSTMDLVSSLAGSNPMQRIRERTDTYWSRQFQHKLVAMAEGVRLHNIATDGSDMVYDISLQIAGAVAAGNLFSRNAFTKAAFTSGDRFDDFEAIAMHSAVFETLTSQQLIDFVQPADVPLPVPTYDGKFVVVDDGCPVIADGNNAGVKKYVTYLFGRGVFGFGEGQAPVPVEVFRWPAKGNGGGNEELYVRKRWLLACAGHSFTSTTVASKSPTNAELALPANWSRKVPRKNVPLAYLITNG